MGKETSAHLFNKQNSVFSKIAQSIAMLAAGALSQNVMPYVVVE
jgi:hypothetical protein